VLMGFATGFLPVLWRLQQMILHSAWLDFLLWPSPAFAFRHSFDAWYWSRPGKSEFWLSVQTLWLLSALCLAWASFITPRTWQRELEPRRLRKPRRKPRGWEEAEAEDPFCRVTIRDWAPSSLANTLLAAGVPIWVFFYIGLPRSVVKGGPPLPFLVCIFLGIALHIIVKLLMIVESVSRLNHDRNSGALELLLVTPLPVESIIMSQRKSLRAHFRMSLWTLALLNVAMMSWVFEYGPNVEMSHGDRWIFAELFVGGIVVLLTDFEALTWVGMWQGLSKRRAYKAVLSTVVQVLGSCWLFAFIFVFANPIFGSELDAATIFALWFLVGLVVDAICLVTGRRRLTKDFRDAASQRYDKVDRQAA